jgi:hypothetical protein
MDMVSLPAFTARIFASLDYNYDQHFGQQFTDYCSHRLFGSSNIEQTYSH